MAKYNITSLNYIASGVNRSYINMDLQLDYGLFDYLHLLCAETRTSAYASTDERRSGDESKLKQVSVDIGTEHGTGKWHITNYIQKADDTALSRELCADGIVLNEEQDVFVETDSSSRDYIRLYLSCCTEEMRQKISQFNLDREKINCSFLADNTANDKNELTCSGQRIQNLYDIVDVSIKKLGIKESQNVVLQNLDRHHDVYAPPMASQPLGFCQTNSEADFGNDALMLTDGTKQTPYYLRTSQLDIRGSGLETTTFTTHLESGLEKTYAYQKPKSNVDVIENWIPRINYQGVSKSWILDLPVEPKSSVGAASDVASYDDGVVYAQKMMPTKSTLNPQYTTEMSAQTDLLNCRTYTEIKSVGGKPYLKFYDDVNYTVVGTVESTSALQNVQTKTVNSQTGLANDTLTKPYQKIEFVYPVDYKTNAKHKSNLFNVELSGTWIETELERARQGAEQNIARDSEKKQKLEQIKFDIESAIKEIAKNVSPANTQLFKITFLD